MAFQEEINRIIDKVEGGFSDNPKDKGGPTNWGITQATARAYGYFGDMRSMPREVALDIYTQRYWIDPKFADVAFISEKIALKLLDIGINMGQATGVKFLQRALNVLNREAKDFPDISMDGVLGAISLNALKRFMSFRGKAGEETLMIMISSLQCVRYIEIAERDPSQEEFEFGWQKERVRPK